MPGKQKAMATIRSKLNHADEIRGQELVELLATHGGFRPNAVEIFGEGSEVLPARGVMQ